MTAEIEAAVVDSHREFLRRKPRHVRPVGSLCPNCEAVLQGPWCHQCGQSAEEMHRSVWRVIGEVVQDFTHFDGRFWKTIPALILKPGRLTRDYIEGHRAAQVPPLRMFLIVLLLVFTAGSIARSPVAFIKTTSTGGGRTTVSTRSVRTLKDLTPAERAEFEQGLDRIKVKAPAGAGSAASLWLTIRLKAVVADPQRFKLILEGWAERFAFLMLPIAALLLSGLFAFQRRFYVFDHTVFALHSLAFQGMLLTLILLLRPFTRTVADLLALAAPIHLFLHMRGAYRTSILGTLLRMFLLLIGSTIGFSLLLVGLLAVGLSAMNG